MRIAILGAGAVGSLFGALLAESGEDVVLLDNHPERAERVNREGLRFEGASGEMTVRVRAAVDFREGAGADLFMVCVKAYSTPEAARRLAPLVGEKSVALSLQNGVGNVERICEVVPREKVIAGTTSQGVNVKAPGHIHHAGTGETVIGELDSSRTERIENVAATFSRAGIPTRASDNVKAVLWGKLLVNVGINPLTALLRVRNGELLRRPAALALMHRAVLEAYRVCSAKGITLEFPDPIKKAEEVARLTGENISSMHQDVRAGKRTEIEAICGTVAGEAERLGFGAPVNELLLNLVRAMEESGAGGNAGDGGGVRCRGGETGPAPPVL
ncbi:MAG: ketopantoate reductase family protein [bacterium]